MMQTMAIPHVILSSDSEGEIEEPLGTPAPNPNMDLKTEPEENMETDPEEDMESESEEESDPEEDMDIDTGSESDDSINEEMVMEAPPAPLSPPIEAYDRSGPHTIRVPHKSVANSCRRQNPSPTPIDIPMVPPVAPLAAPANDPYRRPPSPPADAQFRWVRDTLEEWRKLDIFPPMPDMGESSNAHQQYPFTHEPPHHTIPILIAHTARQDDKLDLIEDVVMDLPLNEMNDQIYSLIGQATTLEDEVEDLKGKAVEGTSQTKKVEERLDGIEARMELLDAMITSMKEIVTKLLKKQDGPK